MLPVKSGRIAAPLSLSVVRELTREDLLRLATEPTERVATPPLQRLRAPHHAAARMLAAGKTAKEVAILVGYTPQRIGDLQRDPTFVDLVAYYADQITEAELEDAARLRRKLTTVAEAALDEIHERLDDDTKREKIPIGELRQITEMGADRTVAPPKTATPILTTPAQITFNIQGPATAQPKVIEHEPAETAEAEAAKKDDNGPTGK